MELEMEKEEYYVVNYSDLNRFINKYYSLEKGSPSEYHFVDDEEANNDSSYTFSVNGEVDEAEEEDLKGVLEDKLPFGFMTHTFLNDLARKDVIPKGSYLVTVCW